MRARDGATDDRRRRRGRRRLIALALAAPAAVYLEPLCAGFAPPCTALANLAPALGKLAVPAALVLALLRRLRAAAALAAAAALLAPAALGPELRGLGRGGAAPPAPPGAAAGRLRVLTANLGDHRSRGPAVAALIRAADADVVSLQEVGPHHVEALRGLRDVLPHQRVEPLGIDGMALLSRLAPASIEVVPLGERIALRAVLAPAPGRRLTVLDAHPSVWVALLGRLDDDARGLVALAERAAADGPALILGDLNTTTRSWLHRRLRAAGFRDAWTALGRGAGPTFPLFGRWRGLPSPPVVRVDHVLATAPLAPLAIERGADVGSDHLPVIAELLW